MREIEGLKEAVKETLGEPPKESPKELKIQKFYKICWVIFKILIGALIFFSLILLILDITIEPGYGKRGLMLFFLPIIFLVPPIFIICLLLIISGLALYVLNRTDKK